MAALNLTLILDSALALLKDFADIAGSDIRLQQVFGAAFNPTPLLAAWRAGAFPTLPKVVVIDSATINGALGAYGQETDTIYLSQQLLATGNLETVTAVFLEEYGHYLDAQINATDTPGDEGALFSATVQGIELTPTQLANIAAEDDSAQVVIDGQLVAIEQLQASTSLFVRGYYVYSLDSNGLTVFDV